MRRVDAHDLAARQALLRVVARFGLDAVDRAARSQVPRRGGAARKQAATADRRDQHVERADLLDQLDGQRALPRHHVRMIERWNHGHAALLGQRTHDGLRVFAVAVVAQHLRAVAFGGGALGGGRVVRHHHRGLHAEQRSGQRDGLRMVARREGDHAAGTLLRRELRDRVVGAADLEGADALLVLALEEELRAGQRVSRARAQHRRAVSHAGNALVGAGDVVEGDRKRGVHGAHRSSRGDS